MDKEEMGWKSARHRTKEEKEEGEGELHDSCCYENDLSIVEPRVGTREDGSCQAARHHAISVLCHNGRAAVLFLLMFSFCLILLVMMHRGLLPLIAFKCCQVHFF